MNKKEGETTTKNTKTSQKLQAEVEELRLRLEEAEETLRAIRNNEVDALVIDGPQGQQVFTLQGAEWPYRTLMETMSEGALTITMDGTILFCNSHLSDLVKIPLNKLIGASFHDFVRPVNGQSLEALLRTCGREGCRGEFFFESADGKNVPVSLSARELMLDDLKAFCIVAADLTDQKRIQHALEEDRDRFEENVAERTSELLLANATLQKEITERKQIEEELRLAAETFEKTFHGNSAAMALSRTRDGYILDTNDRWLALTGFRREDVIGKTTTELRLWKDPEDRAAIVRDVERHGSVFDRECVLLRKNGQEWTALFYAQIITLQGEQVLISSAVDITERKQTEEKLEAARREAENEKRRLEIVMETLPVGVAIVDAKGGNIMGNHAFEQIWGDPIPRTDSVADYAPFKAWWLDTERPVEPEEWASARAIKNGETVVGQLIKIERFDGSHAFIHNSAAPIFGNDGQTLGGAVAIMDITEQMETEEALQKAHDELESRIQERTFELSEAYETLRKEVEEHKKTEEQLVRVQKLEALGTLAGGIAHDFNNILASIIGFTEMVMEDLTPDRPEQKKLELVLKSAHRGRDLVQQILTFSRQDKPDRKPLNLNQTVEQGLKMLRPALPSIIEITSKCSTDDEIILADPVQMQQVLINLVTNASHAMREKGGILHIGISDTALTGENPALPPDITPGEYVVLEVVDTGVGMTSEIIERIFDPFFTTKMQGEGTGLGLSVVHGIVRSHRGNITVKSELGKGTIFHVYLPKIKEGVSPEDNVNPTATTGGKERILIVDDEDILVELNEQRLSKLGYEIVATTSAMDALDIFREEPDAFDLVVTDQTMPNLTGMDLAAELLKIKATIPIILCTGHSEIVSPGMAKEAGIKAFLMKPLTKEELARTIRRVLDAKREGGV